MKFAYPPTNIVRIFQRFYRYNIDSRLVSTPVLKEDISLWKL